MAIDYTRRPSPQPAPDPPAAGGVSYTKAPRPSPEAPAPPTGGSRPPKVTLTKTTPSISLTKSAGAHGQMRMNLNWTSVPPGDAYTKATPIDLDLGCLFELTDGRKGVVQSLGNAFGALDRPPYVLLDGDDRSGQVSGGENLVVNLDQLDQLRRVLVFAHIYDGAPNWAAADAVVTLYPVGAGPIEVRLDADSATARTVAVALLTNDGGRLTVQREVRYIDGTQSDLDRAYGWGMRWQTGTK